MRSFIEKFISLIKEKQLIAKIISIFLAVVLWGYIYDSKTGRIKFEAQIEYTNLPPQFTITSPTLKAVTVNIDGKKDYIKNIDIKNLKPTVNLENPKLDQQSAYQISVNRHQIPDSISVSLSSDKVHLTVERLSQKRVRIMPVLKGELPLGYVAGRIKTLPESVTITGARSLIDNISYINTEPLVLDNVNVDISKDVDLRPDPGSDIILSDSIVRVNVTIFKMDELYSIEVPVAIRNFSHEFSHKPAVESVRVYLRKTEKASIKPSDFDISINAGTIEKNMKKEKKARSDSSFPVDIILKQQNRNAEIINYSPDSINVITEYNEEKPEENE